MRIRQWGSWIAAGALACAAQLALAQEPPEATAEPPLETIAVDSEPAQTAPDTPAMLDEIVVTARRRKERIADVPASLLVLDGAALAEANLTLATDIQERVAGLVVSVPNMRLTSYTIRGLGSSSANDGIESSVGLFLDGIYLGRQGLSIFDLIDLERVEVLRGPQGTLSGKNTTAGAINIVTRAPEPGYEADLEGTYGAFGARLLRGSVNDATDDGRFAARLTGYLSNRDGTVHNIYHDNLLNDRDKQGLRGQLLWTFDGGTGRFIGEYGSAHEACCAFPLTAPVRPIVIERDAYMEYTRVGTNPADRMTDSDAPTRSDMRQQALSAEFNQEIGANHTVTLVSGVRDWFFLPLNDDATSLELASTSTRNEHRQYSEELRVASDFGAFDSVAGLFYMHQKLVGLERVILGEDMAGWVFGGEIRSRSDAGATEATTGQALYTLIPPESLDGLTVDTRYFQHSDAVAAFGSLDWHLTDRLDATTGLRYTHEWKKGAVDRTRYGGNPEASPLATADPILPIIDATYPEFGEALGYNDVQSFGYNGIIDDVAGGEYQRADQMNEGNWSAQLALSYELAADNRVYASAARGYKGGGINLGFTGTSIKPIFRPERATSYEVGSKLRLFEAVFLSLAVYHTEITDYQALTFDDEQVLLRNPRQINLLNIGKVRLRGAEFEGYGYIGLGLRARFGVAYSDTIMKSFPNAPNEDEGTNTRDLSGEVLYNAPRWSGNAGLEHHLLFDSGHELYTGVDWSARTGYWGTVEHGTSSRIDGYDLGNVRMGLRPVDKHWDVTLWSRNVLDHDYLATVYPLYGVGDYGAVPADPRSWGLTLRMALR